MRESYNMTKVLEIRDEANLARIPPFGKRMSTAGITNKKILF